MLVVFSSAYLLSVYFLWWNVVSNLWPIWKVGFLCFYWILQVLHIVCIEVHYLICKYFLCGLLFIFLVVVGCLVTKLCPTPAMDCSLPGSSVHGILQARILEWAAMPSSRESSQSNPHLLCLLHWLTGSLPLAPPGKPMQVVKILKCLVKSSGSQSVVSRPTTSSSPGNVLEKHILGGLP